MTPTVPRRLLDPSLPQISSFDRAGIVPVQRDNAFPEAQQLAAERVNQMPPPSFDMAMTNGLAQQQPLSQPPPLSQEALYKIQTANQIGPPTPVGPAVPAPSPMTTMGREEFFKRFPPQLRSFLESVMARRDQRLAANGQPATPPLPAPIQPAPPQPDRAARIQQILANRSTNPPATTGFGGLLNQFWRR